MCEGGHHTFSRYNRETKKLHGFIGCECGEREVPITLTPNGRRELGIEYEITPDLRRADLIAEEQQNTQSAD